MFCFIFICFISSRFDFILMESGESDDANSGENLVTSLRDDANLDLSVDEEYEDLRTEFLAYHTALTSLVDSRRSLMTAPCAKAGGICIDYKLCPGYRQVTEIPGCKNRYNVCCFVWNLYEVRDHSKDGLKHLGYPWTSYPNAFVGKGIIDLAKHGNKKRKKRVKETEHKPDVVVVTT